MQTALRTKAQFAGDTNKITIARDNIEGMPLMSKSEAADIIIDAAKKLMDDSCKSAPYV